MVFFQSLTNGYSHNTAHDEPDFCSDAGAKILAEKIKSYWLARGYDIKIKLEHQEFHPAVRSARSDIRSNLINGMPPNYHPAVKY